MKHYWLILPNLVLILLAGCGGNTPAASISIPAATERSTPSPSPTPTPLATHIRITPAAIATQMSGAGALISSGNANQLGLFARWGSGNSDRARYTPDGKYLVAAYSTGIYFYNAGDFSFAKSIDLNAPIFGIVISSDGKKMAATSLDKVFLFDLGNDTPLFSIDASVISLAFSPDNKTLALGIHTDKDDLVQLWDVGNKQIIREFSSKGGFIHAIAFSPDGKFLASADNATRIWNLDGTPLDIHGGYVSGGVTFDLSFSSDGSLLAESAYTSGNIIHIWRVLKNGRLVIFRVLVPRKEISWSLTVSFSPDGKLLAVGMSDGTYLWQVSSGTIVHKLSNNSGSVAWSPDSQFLVLPGEAGMQVFKSTNGELVQTFNALTGPVETLAWSPSGREVVRATGSGHIAALDAQKGDIVATYDGDLIQNCFAFSPDGKFLAIKTGAFANTSGEVTVYNLADSNFRKVLKDSYGAGMTGESFSRDGAYLAIQGFDDGQNVIQIWKTSDWSLFRSWKIPKGLINGLIFNADGQTVALTYSDDETNSDIKSILILRSIDGSTVQNLPITSPIGRPIIYGISFSPDGQSLLSVSEAYFSEQEHHLRQVLKLWQTSNDKLLYSLDDIPERKRLSPLFRDTHYLLNSIAWSPDGTLFAVGMSDGTLQVRRASDGELLQTLSGHTLRVTAAAFSPDGRLLASGSLDGTIRIWGILQNP